MVRHKNRYMVIEINPGQPTKDGSLTINSSALFVAVSTKLQQLHGDYGVAATRHGLVAKYFNEKTRIGLIRARHGPHRLIASTLPCVTNIAKKEVSVNTLYTGATMKQCFKFILAHQQKKVDEVWVSLKNDEERQALKEALFNFDEITKIT